jgi:hypothetical protein
MADYGSLQDHADAIMDALRAETRLTVYPAETGGATMVPNGAEPPYVSVHIAGDYPLGGRMSHLSTRTRVRAYCHCVGADDTAARAVHDLVRGALLDLRVTIPGRACYPIRYETGRDHDPRATETTGVTVVTITDCYRLESEPGVDGS